MKNPFIALDHSLSPIKERMRIEKAWEQFVAGQKTVEDIRSLTFQSWKRSLNHGVHPLHSIAPITLSEEVIAEYRARDLLYSTLDPLLVKLKEAAIDSGYLITFCNSNGEIFYIDGDDKIKREAEKMNFIAGTSWSEQHVGTNGMGTSLATGYPIQIFASEHFCKPVHNWVCSAAPIKDPATNKTLGAANITGIWKGVHPHSLSTVVSIALSIERELQNRLNLEHFFLLEYFMEMTNRKGNCIAAVIDRGYKVIKASPPFYENNWVNQNGNLTILDVSYLPMEPYRWELNGNKGKWAFEATPYYSQGAFIGFFVCATKTSRPLSKGAGNTVKHTFSSIIGQSEVILSLLKEAKLLSNLDLSVTIEGESGTGKELLAQSIHAASPRSSGPFVAVNCGAIPRELAESELFGYEEGAFTGGVKGGHKGKFLQADGGTIFLDEIGEMPLDLQTALLRVLEEKEITRLGGKQPIPINVRVIAATNRDLKRACELGEFRRDLYYRLSILSLQVPPLRNRKGDIPIILDHLIQKICAEIGRPLFNVSPDVLRVIEKYHWPGNVRELRNFIYKMAVRVKGQLMTMADLPEDFLSKGISSPANESRLLIQSPSKITSSLKQLERETILSVLEECNGNITKAAKKLGIHRSTIYRKLGNG